MDPQVRAFLAAANAAPQPPIDTLPPAVAREQFAALTPIFHPFVDVAESRDLRTAGGVPLRLYHPNPSPSGRLPAVVYLHGGGWVLGDLETHDTLCRHLANSARAAVIAVDYRRAPEHPFPAAFDDTVSAVGHVFAHADELGIDPNRIALAGDSAGGNLAAAVALKSRDPASPRLALQCLIYPVLDHRCDTPSYAEFADGFGLTRAKMRYFWKCYLGQQDGSSPLLSPLRTEDVAGLPPALIITAEYDVLRDEGEAYAAHLASGGIEVEAMRVDGVIHGFIHYAGAIHRGRSVLQEVGARIAARLG